MPTAQRTWGKGAAGDTTGAHSDIPGGCVDAVLKRSLVAMFGLCSTVLDGPVRTAASQSLRPRRLSGLDGLLGATDPALERLCSGAVVWRESHTPAVAR